jgi:hypothetical protein
MEYTNYFRQHQKCWDTENTVGEDLRIAVPWKEFDLDSVAKKQC